MVLARYQGDRLRDYIETKIESWLCLELNRDKTKVIDLRQPGTELDFLGYTFRYNRDLKGRGFRYLHVAPSQKALAVQRERVRAMTSSRRCHVPIPRLLKEVNVQLRGWARYFSFGHPRKAMRAMNWYVRCRVIKHLGRRSQRPFRPPKGQTYYQRLKQLGLVYL